MYTLIITIVLYAHDFRAAGSPAIESVNGFTTIESCEEAKKNYLAQNIPNGSYQTVLVTGVCVKY